MAIRHRKKHLKSLDVYWNNPYTGKRQFAHFSAELEAKKHDALMKYKLTYEKEAFMPDDPVEEKREEVTTLGEVYTHYLRVKAFSKADLRWQMSE